MKVRAGFVSNSSSSSFVIAFKKGEKCPTCGRSGEDLVSLFPKERTGYCDDTRLNASSYEEVMNYVRCNYYDDEKEKALNHIEDFHKRNPDFDFIACTVSYHDEMLNDLMASMEERGEIKYVDKGM